MDGMFMKDFWPSIIRFHGMYGMEQCLVENIYNPTGITEVI